MKRVKAVNIFLAAAMALSGCSGAAQTVRAPLESTSELSETTAVIFTEENDFTTAAEECNELSANEAVRLMGNGINLGNTMEAYNHSAYLTGADPVSFETLWGQPVTTREMIDGMKAAGFDTLRIPVAWTNGMNFESGDYTIDKRLMDRVEEIVNFALDADMYVIVNDHWDGSWWGMFGSETRATRDQAMEIYKSMWNQIADRFGDYSYKLIFESANEELGDRLNDKDIAKDSGALSKAECYETAYMINSEFVNLIRSKGGRNADRFLLIAGYNTDIANTCKDSFKMPEDTAENKLMISVHYYTPWDYCGTDSVDRWGSPGDYKEQNSLLEMMSSFTQKGYGVVIGEYAVMSDKGGQKPDSDLFYNNFLDNCDYYNYCPVLWDCNGLYKRQKGQITDETFAKIYLDRSFSAQSSMSDEEVKSKAYDSMEAAALAAEERLMESAGIPASDEAAIAWIMFNSADYGIAYSVGDTYDPTNMTTGVKAENVEITGEGTYTVSLDFSDIGAAKGIAFSALGISNGERLFPNYIYTVDRIEINGKERKTEGVGYTASDDGLCTRVNLYNQWVKQIPSGARTAEGSSDDLSATIISVGDNERIKTISVTFTVTAP